MKDNLNKFVDTSILIAAFWSAIIMAFATFIRNAWATNNMNEKVQKFILWILTVVDNISDVIRDNMGVVESIEIETQQGGDAVPVAKVSTKRPKRS